MGTVDSGAPALADTQLRDLSIFQAKLQIQIFILKIFFMLTQKILKQHVNQAKHPYGEGRPAVSSMGHRGKEFLNMLIGDLTAFRRLEITLHSGSAHQAAATTTRPTTESR